MKTNLLIVYESADGVRALPVARITDRGILLTVAVAALSEKRGEALRIQGLDHNLGAIANAEAAKLETILAALIPGFPLSQPVAVMPRLM